MHAAKRSTLDWLGDIVMDLLPAKYAPARPIRKQELSVRRRSRMPPAMPAPLERNRSLEHSQRLHVGFQDGFLFLPLVGILLAQTDDGAQRLDVEAVALGFAVD